MIRLFVIPKMLAESIELFADNTLVISIGSPGGSKAKLKGDHVYFFEFHDIDRDIYDDSKEIMYEAMKPIMAESIVEVAFNNRDKRNWIIHCEAGISRSPGVALGLAKFIALSPGVDKLEVEYPCYNRHVRRLIEEAGEKKVEEIN